MHSQHSDPDTIEKEKLIIKGLANLQSTDNIELNERGWDSRVYSFDEGRCFFKFPRSKEVQLTYQYEIAAIKHMANLQTDVKVQNIIWEHPENAYFGYEGVVGQPLNIAIQKLSEPEIQKIGTSIGKFLKELHQYKLVGARTMTTDNEAEQIEEWYEKNSNKTKHFFEEEEQKTLKHLVYEVWPSRINQLGYDPVLSHGDLHFENILYKNGVVGVIDFGDVAYYDRSKDFIELELNKTIFDTALEAYGNSDEQLLDKARLRQDMIQIINLGFYAGKNDQNNTKLTVNKIKEFLRNP
jgi:aminoglycoside phosphotransferase (APT) family kinase protein